MNSFLRCCLGLLAAVSVAWAAPSHPGLGELGNPFIRNYAQKEYEADSQNWAIVRDPRGLVYVGNNLGLLEYDGSRWRLIQTPRRTTVRSLALDGQGRVFVGAVGEIGYLAPDASGQMAFVDLTPKLEPSQREFSDVWAVASTPQGVLFQCREYLFLWERERFQAIKADSTFHLAFAPRGRIFVRQRGIGLMELIAHRLTLLPGGERFANESIFMMVPLTTSPAPGQDRFLIGSRNKGLWSFEGRTLKPFPSEVDAFLKRNTLYHGIRLADGTLAMATLRGGLVLMDPQGRWLGNLTRDNGLLGDNIKHVWEDGKGYLWMALDNGISKVEYPSPFSHFDERFGLKGNIWGIHRHKGRLYVATGQGVFVLSSNPREATQPRFRPLAEISTQALCLLSLEDELLVATSQGVFAIQGDRARPIRPSSNVAISLHRSRQNPDRVFVGLQGAFASLLRTPSGWIDEGPIPAIRDDIYSIAESEAGQLWLGTPTQGLIRVHIPAEWKGVASGKTPEVERFDGRHGLPEDAQVYAQRVDGRVLFGTKDGFYGFDESQRRFRPEARLGGLFPEGRRWIRSFRADPQGRIWANTKDEVRGVHESGAAVL